MGYDGVALGWGYCCLLQAGSVQGGGDKENAPGYTLRICLSSVTTTFTTGLKKINLCFNDYHDTFKIKYAIDFEHIPE